MANTYENLPGILIEIAILCMEIEWKLQKANYEQNCRGIVILKIAMVFPTTKQFAMAKKMCLDLPFGYVMGCKKFMS